MMEPVRDEWTSHDKVLIAALTAVCEGEAEALEAAVAAYERLTDVPAFLRARMAGGSLVMAERRVRAAHKALSDARDAHARWLSRTIAQA